MKALECWISIERRLKEVARNNPQWQEAARLVWERFMLTTEATREWCPCGWNGNDELFLQHLKDTHLSSIVNPKEKAVRRRKKLL